MSKRAAMYAAVPAVVIGLAFAPTAFAHGFGGFMAIAPEDAAKRHAQVFQQHATTLGLPVDVLKDGWADGKSIREIATASGLADAQVSERLAAAYKAHMKAQVQAMVTSGVITQAQADRRLQALDRLAAGRSAKMGKRLGWRMHW